MAQVAAIITSVVVLGVVVGLWLAYRSAKKRADELAARNVDSMSAHFTMAELKRLSGMSDVEVLNELRKRFAP